MSSKREVKARSPGRGLARYLSAPYVRMIIPNAEEAGYLAEVLELPGCITEGDTPEEAYRNLEDAMAGWIRASLDTNRPIPEPVGDKEYSGHFPLRMSSELHRAAALRAMQEGVSLNQWIVGAIAAQVTSQNLAEDLADRIAAKVAERIPASISGAGFWFDVGPGGTQASTSSRQIQARLEHVAVQDTPTDLYNALFLQRARFGRQLRIAIEDRQEVKPNA